MKKILFFIFSWFTFFAGNAFAFDSNILNVCATIPELGSLAREIGGDKVSIQVFAKGTEDPHYIDAKPSYIRKLRDADLFIQIGMDLEIGWAPFLLKNSRNKNIQPGGSGFLDASQAITPLDIPVGTIDRTMGDIHPQGNPHYLADPINGLKVAALIKNRLSALQQKNQEYFSSRFEDFRNRLAVAMIGKDLADKYDFEKISLLYEHERLEDFLRTQGEIDLLDGWLGALQPFQGRSIITYHNSWPYLVKRFGLVSAAHLEPKAGIPPSPAHLLDVINTAKAKKANVILMEPWLNKKPARFVADKAKCVILKAAISTRNNKSEAYNYIAALEGLITQLEKALALK
jgi:ABC-type Zn uptake system ZnuABC Zn-binding protein ZnuA